MLQAMVWPCVLIMFGAKLSARPIGPSFFPEATPIFTAPIWAPLGDILRGLLRREARSIAEPKQLSINVLSVNAVVVVLLSSQLLLLLGACMLVWLSFVVLPLCSL